MAFYPYYYGMMGGFGFGWLFMILLAILFFLIIWWIFRASHWGHYHPASEKRAVKEEPLDILKMRLAKGEITRKEYSELKREIEGDEDAEE